MTNLATGAPGSSIATNVIDPVTIQQTMDGSWADNLSYSSILTAIEKSGNVQRNGGGQFLTKNIKVGLGQAVDVTAATVNRVFNQENDYVNLFIPWTAVEAPRALSAINVALNSTPEGKVKLANELVPTLVETMREGLFTRILNGNAGATATAGFGVYAGSGVAFNGLPTLFGYGATAQNYNPDTRATTGNWTTASKEVLPNTSYFGVSTNPLTPPASVTNPHYEALSPVITAYNATAATWGNTGNADWANNCREVLNHHITRQTRGNGPNERPDLGIMSATMYTALVNTFQQYYRTVLAGQSSDPNMRAISGTDQVIPYGPLSLGWDAYLTQAVCYVLNSKKLGLTIVPQQKIVIDPSMPNKGSSMFAVKTNFDMSADAHLVNVQMISQLWMDPRYHGMSYAAT